MKLNKLEDKLIIDFLYSNELEICNSSYTFRIIPDQSDNALNVCKWHDPLHPIKSFKTVKNAVNFINKENNE